MADYKMLAATARPRHLVNRIREMHLIHDAIATPGKECRVVLIKGPGGLGKTRLLEEVLRRTGHAAMRDFYGDPLPQDDWAHLVKKAAFADIIDLTDIKFHVRESLLQHLGNSTTWGNTVAFPRFALANNRFQRVADVGAAYSLLGPAIKQAEKAFIEDLQNAAQKRRLVIMFDTAEQLTLSSSTWLQDHGLTEPEDLASSAQQWLLEQIAHNKFPNITFIIAGRDSEGSPFFEEVERTVTAPKSRCTFVNVSLDSFDLESMGEYLSKVRADWVANSPQAEQTLGVLSTLDEVLNNADRIQILRHYTGGSPVLLSMYIDILYEGHILPDQLKDSYAEAIQRTSTDDDLAKAQREIEAAFIDLLFRSGQTLRAQILQALVRAPRGLNEEQLHFWLDGTKPASDWEADSERLAKIQHELGEIRKLTLIRVKADGRIGLQDEVYRIYAERMQKEPEFKAEISARALLYKKMYDWASHQVNKLESVRQKYIAEDLGRIRIERPANVLSSRMQPLTPWEQEQRQTVNSALSAAELEQLHYALLVNPSDGFNSRYYNLSLRQSKTFNPAAVAMAQAEMWRILNDERTLSFTNIPVYPAAQERGETGAQVLRRAAEQDIATQAIIYRYLRKDYDEAVKLADQIDATVAGLKNRHEKNSWNHTLARANRGCWREFARIYSGIDIPTAINSLKEMVQELEKLAQADMKMLVFEDRGQGEKGFIGHPAQQRLLFLIANVYDFIGYGQVSLGSYQEAVDAYTASLQYWRQQKLPVARALEASTRNNLSRALVEMGKKRSIRICLDALALRVQAHQLLPIALSYNTLGLIHNDLKQPYEALDASARALAIAQFIGDTRVVGLALLQVGEALRRLAALASSRRRSGEAEDLFSEAEKTLQQAYEIFTQGEASQELVRRVEATLELGTLYREWVAAARTDPEVDVMPTPENILSSRHNNALQYLTQSADLAGNNVHLALDAWVNIAWTHYYAKDFDRALKALAKADDLVKHEEDERSGAPIRLRPRDANGRVSLSDPTEYPAFWYKQLSKMHTLRGEIALTHFKKKEKSDSESRRSENSHEYLESAARDYTLAPAYAQMFSPGSAPLTAAYDSLYDFLKTLNLRELLTFYGYEQAAHEMYAIETVSRKFKNLGDLGDFLKDCFGDPERLANLAATTQEGAQREKD